MSELDAQSSALCVDCETPTDRESGRCQPCERDHVDLQEALLRIVLAIVIGGAAYFACHVLLDGFGGGDDFVPPRAKSLILAPGILLFLAHKLVRYTRAPLWMALCPHLGLPFLLIRFLKA